MDYEMKRKIILVFLLLLIITPPALYFGGRQFSWWYAEKWANKLISLDEQNLLSTHFGAAWQDVVYDDQYREQMEQINGSDGTNAVTIVEGLPVEDYPAISVIERLNRIDEYSNQILILDRNEREIARIKTDHRRISYDSVPQVLIQSICAAEDKTFFENDHGFSYESFVRAAARSVIQSIKSGSKRSPRGTSTVTQQVGKMLVSQLDSKGQRYVSRSIDRKLREIRLAAALRKRYSAEEIMEVYLNHCVTSSYGLIGVADITEGLFHKPIGDITDAEAVYLSRMVKWGMNIPDKIKRQCHIDMERIQERLEWSNGYRDSVLLEIDSLEFFAPRQVTTEQGHLVDLANIYWMKFLEQQGYSATEQSEVDLLDPTSLIRKKGDLTIQLTIDLPLQTFITKQIDDREFLDSTIVTDLRVGSMADTLTGDKPRQNPPRWVPRVLTTTEQFSDPGATYYTTLDSGETLYTNVSFDYGSEDDTLPEGQYRKVSRFYRRGEVYTEQYYAYGILDAKSGELRAYRSRDRIGSDCASLFGRPVPNGSSTIKPILYTLMYDLGIFNAEEKWDDRIAVEDSVPWLRTTEYLSSDSSAGNVYFQNTANGQPYRVKNHGNIFEGNQYIYDHLTRSNNILAVEALYRLNGFVFDSEGNLNREHFQIGQLFTRLGIYDRMRTEFAGKEITGVRVIKEIARIVGAEVDSVSSMGNRYALPDEQYSVALGTMEMPLLQQAHLFNMLYDNSLIQNPADHISLFVKSITVDGKRFEMDTLDQIVRYTPLGVHGNKSNLRPTQLGLFWRLRETAYDIPLPEYLGREVDDTAGVLLKQTERSVVLSNFAKSGTTDDIRRPFHYDRLSSARKTNYCLWNGVVRVDMNKLGDSLSDTSEISDLTVACIGEGSRLQPSGRDGKSQHRFMTRGLLRTAGTKSSDGFYSEYRTHLDSLFTTDSLYQDSIVQDSLEQIEKDTTGMRGFFRNLFGKNGEDSTDLIDSLELDTLSDSLTSLDSTEHTAPVDTVVAVDEENLSWAERRRLRRERE